MGGERRLQSLTKLAGRQWAVIRITQLRELGFTDRQTERLVLHGILHRRFRGIYTYATDRPPWQGVLLAAQWSCGEDAYLTGRTALALDKICGQFLRRIEVAVPRRTVRPRPAPVQVQRVSLPPGHLRRNGPLRYAGAAAAIADRAAQGAKEQELRRLIREAIHANRLDHAEMRHLLENFRGRRGLRILAAAYDAYLPKLASDSGLETSFDTGRERRPWIPAPEAHHPVQSGGITWTIDRYWPEHKVGVELQSRYHDAHEDREQDEFKAAKLAVLGIQLLYFSEDRWGLEPDSCLDDLEATLAIRGWHRAT